MRTAPLRRSNVGLALIVALLPAGGASAKAQTPKIVIQPHCGKDGALLSLAVAGQLIDANASDAAERVKALAGDAKAEDIHFMPDKNDSYRCVGGAIFLLQKSNVPMKIGFISDPEPRTERAR